MSGNDSWTLALAIGAVAAVIVVVLLVLLLRGALLGASAPVSLLPRVLALASVAMMAVVLGVSRHDRASTISPTGRMNMK